MSASGGGIWNDSEKKTESGGPSSWNVDIFVQTVRDLVRFQCVRSRYALLNRAFVFNECGLRAEAYEASRWFLTGATPELAGGDSEPGSSWLHHRQQTGVATPHTRPLPRPAAGSLPNR